MSYLILPGDVLARIYDQPIALNFAHAGLTRLVAAWYARDGDRPFDMVRGLTGGKSGSFPMARSTTHEMGFAHRTPFGGVETTDLPEWARSNNPTYSLLAISLNTGSTASSQVAITQQGAGWAGAQIYEGNGSSNVIRGGTTRDTTSAGSTGIAVPIGRRYCAVVVDQSTTIQCAVNGQLDTAGSPAGSYNATQSRLASGDSARPVYLMLCWRRALSQGEQIEYSARPDQLFKREPEVSYFLFQAAGGGGTTTYTYAGSGTVTISGAATLLKGKIGPASGTVTVSGAATTSFTSGATTYTYAGSGTVVVSGAAGLVKGKIGAASGTVVVSGAATLVKGKIGPASGTVVVSGAAATEWTAAGATSYPYAGSGTITVSGAFALLKGKAVAGSGTITVSGAAATSRASASGGAVTATLTGDGSAVIGLCDTGTPVTPSQSAEY